MPNFAIGVDLGGTNLRIAVVDEEGRLLEKVTLGTRVSLGRDQVIVDMVTAIRSLTAKFRDLGTILGVGIGVLLLEDGWRVRTRPGTPMVLERDSRTFDPMAAVAALSDGTMTTDQWRAQCAAIGIAGRRLGIAA